jgi:hypothetical protein
MEGHNGKKGINERKECVSYLDKKVKIPRPI